MDRKNAGLIWLLLILLLSISGFIMMFHYDEAVVFGYIEGDLDSKSSIEQLFRFSDYPATMKSFSTANDLEKALRVKQVDYVVYSYLGKIDEQLHEKRLAVNQFAELLSVVRQAERGQHFSTALQRETATMEIDFNIHRHVFSDYLEFLNNIKKTPEEFSLTAYLQILEKYAAIKSIPQAYDFAIHSRDKAFSLKLRDLFRPPSWQGRKIESSKLFDAYMAYTRRHRDFPLSVEFVLRNRHYDRPVDYAFLQSIYTKDADRTRNEVCVRASKMLDYQVEYSAISKKGEELQRLLLEAVKHRNENSMNAMLERLHSTILCY